MSTTLSQTSQKVFRISAWLLSIPLFLLFVFSAYEKLNGNSPMHQHEFLKEWVYVIGVGELFSALLFFIPRTAVFGVLLMSSYSGGMICFHMARGEEFILQALLLGLIWLTHFLRNPQLLSRQ